MIPLKLATVSSVNEYFETLKEQVKKGSPMKATLVTFNSMKHQVVYEDVKIKDVTPLKSEQYQPNHMTPLYDSLARLIRSTDPKVKKSDRALMIIVTDGQENYSNETKLADIQALIRERTEAGNWTFVYIGAHADAWAEAGSMGFSVGNTQSISHDPLAVTRMSRGLASASTSYYMASAGATEHFFDPNILPGDKTKPPKTKLTKDGVKTDDIPKSVSTSKTGE